MNHALEAPTPTTPDLPVVSVDPAVAVQALKPLARVTGLFVLLRPRQWVKAVWCWRRRSSRPPAPR